jgi:DNA-binding HxlR family transcriptional regulator
MSDRRAMSVPKGNVPASEHCSVLKSLEIIGDFWTLAVIRCAAFGIRRFGEFQSELGIASNVLTDRLERLVGVGLLGRIPYRERPLRYEYVLTEDGLELTPIVLALKAWGDRHLQPSGPWTSFHHRGCASPVETSVRCPDCGNSLTREMIEVSLLRTA